MLTLGYLFPCILFNFIPFSTLAIIRIFIPFSKCTSSSSMIVGLGIFLVAETHLGLFRFATEKKFRVGSSKLFHRKGELALYYCTELVCGLPHQSDSSEWLPCGSVHPVMPRTLGPVNEGAFRIPSTPCSFQGSAHPSYNIWQILLNH